MDKSIFAVIACLNEERNIAAVAEKSRKYVQKVVVIDDGSSDQTYNEAKKTGAIVLRHIINLGKGSALKTGCEYAVRNGADIIIAIDADGQHNPDDIPRFISALGEGNDVVFGFRELGSNMPLILRFGNWLINKTTKLLYGMELKDTQCGYRAFTSEACLKMAWSSNGYSVESEMIANIGKHHLKYCEIPIATVYNDKYKGTTVLDGINIIFNMIIWRLRR